MPSRGREMPTVGKPRDRKQVRGAQGLGQGQAASADGALLSERDQTGWSWGGQLYNLENTVKTTKL